MSDHIPVLLTELIAGLKVQPNKDYIDCTLGAGGHAKEILKLNSPKGKVYGLDLDKQAISLAKKKLKEFSDRVVYINENYRTLENIVDSHKIANLNLGGIYVDLGLSSMQLDDHDRGFSFRYDAPLNMSFGDSSNLTAEEILNFWSEEEIGKILYEYGEESWWKNIAAAIVDYRRQTKIITTGQLVDIILSVKKKRFKDKINPATQTFQAIRIAVNDELNGLREFLPIAISLLPSRARLGIISYHSLEDRIVKLFLRQETRDCICPPVLPHCICNHVQTIKIITKKPITPSDDEVKINPRSRSAKLRIAEKI